MKKLNPLPISILTMAIMLISACSQLPVQRGEYDDVYFTSNDRPQAPVIVTDPAELENIEAENIITLEKSSEKKVSSDLVNKYNNGEDERPTYYKNTEEETQANFFSGDFERDNQAFDNLGASSQYNNNASRFNSGFNGGYGSSFSPFGPSFSLGLGFGSGFSSGLYTSFFLSRGFITPFTPFGSPFGFYDPYNPWGFRPYGHYGGFGFNDPFFASASFYNPWWRRNRFRNNFYGGSNVIIINNGELNAGNNRTFERGGRARSTSSISSVRADAIAGTQRRATAAPSNLRGTANGGRTSSAIASRSGNVRDSRSSVDEALQRANRRVSTDRSGNAYRGNSSGVTRNVRSSRSVANTRLSNTRRLAANRTSNYRSSRGVSFARNSSSQSTRAFRPTQSIRSLGSNSRQNSYTRGSSNSSRGRSINRSSRSNSNVRSINRSSSRSRSGGSVSRSSSSRSSGGGATRSSSGGGSSRGGRGGN